MIGNASATQITSDYIESLNEDKIEELKEDLDKMLKAGEVNKKVEVICKKIKSLV